MVEPVSAPEPKRGKKRKGKPAPDEVQAWSDETRHFLRTFRVLQVTVGPLARLLFRTKRQFIERIPRRGPVILVTNHVSNLDPILVVLSMRRPIFHLAKYELFTGRFRSFFFQRMGGQIPVHRGEPGSNEAAIQAALAALRKGFALGIYPEAHRSATGTLRRGKPGLGRIAYLSGAPCYPVAVAGTFQVWPKGQKMPTFFRPTRIVVGEPRVYRVDAAKAADRDACQALTDELMSDLARMLHEPYDPETALPPQE